MAARELERWVERLTPEQAALIVRRLVEAGKVPPLFDHRFDELLEIIKKTYEVEHGWYYSTGVEDYSLGPRERLDLLWATREWRLLHTFARIELPDSRTPEVYFIIYHDGFETIDDPPYKYYENGLVNPNDYGWVTKYDATNYIYAWMVPWDLTVRKELRVQLVNDTSATVTVRFAEVDTIARPYARYFIKKSGKQAGGWG